MSWCPNVLNGHIYIVSCPFLYRITPRRQVWPGGTRTSAATETTRTASPSSPTGRRTGERGCLLSLTWFHREKTQKPASAPRRIWVWVSGQKTHRRSFPFCSRAFLVRLLSHIFGGTCFETHCLFFIVLPSVSAFLRQFFTYKCSFRPTRMEHSSLWTQMWPNSKLVNINIYKTISVSRPHSNSLLFYCWKKIQTESEEKISVVSPRYFLSFYSFFSFLVFIYVPSFFFSHHLYFSFLPVCLWFRAVGGVFFRCGMTSMTEMACATSPSSAFAAAAFGASSSSVRLRYQTVGPLYVGQAGWATLPHSYYALDYCTPK